MRPTTEFRPRLPEDPFGATPWVLAPGSGSSSSTVLVLNTPPQADLAALLYASPALAHSLVIIATHDVPVLPTAPESPSLLPAIRVLRLREPLFGPSAAGALGVMSILDKAARFAFASTATTTTTDRVQIYSEDPLSGEYTIREDPSGTGKAPSFPSSPPAFLSRPPEKKKRRAFNIGSRTSSASPSLHSPSVSGHTASPLLPTALSTLPAGFRPFDTLIHYLPSSSSTSSDPHLPEKILLKQAILVTTLSAPYLAVPPDPPRYLRLPEKYGNKRFSQSTSLLPGVTETPGAVRQRRNTLLSQSAGGREQEADRMPTSKSMSSFQALKRRLTLGRKKAEEGAEKFVKNGNPTVRSPSPVPLSAPRYTGRSHIIHVVNTSDPDPPTSPIREAKKKASLSPPPGLAKSIEQFLVAFAYPMHGLSFSGDSSPSSSRTLVSPSSAAPSSSSTSPSRSSSAAAESRPTSPRSGFLDGSIHAQSTKPVPFVVKSGALSRVLRFSNAEGEAMKMAFLECVVLGWLDGETMMKAWVDVDESGAISLSTGAGVVRVEKTTGAGALVGKVGEERGVKRRLGPAGAGAVAHPSIAKRLPSPSPPPPPKTTITLTSTTTTATKTQRPPPLQVATSIPRSPAWPSNTKNPEAKVVTGTKTSTSARKAVPPTPDLSASSSPVPSPPALHSRPAFSRSGNSGGGAAPVSRSQTASLTTNGRPAVVVDGVVGARKRGGAARNAVAKVQERSGERVEHGRNTGLLTPPESSESEGENGRDRGAGVKSGGVGASVRLVGSPREGSGSRTAGSTGIGGVKDTGAPGGMGASESFDFVQAYMYDRGTSPSAGAHTSDRRGLSRDRKWDEGTMSSPTSKAGEGRGKAGDRRGGGGEGSGGATSSAADKGERGSGLRKNRGAVYYNNEAAELANMSRPSQKPSERYEQFQKQEQQELRQERNEGLRLLGGRDGLLVVSSNQGNGVLESGGSAVGVEREGLSGKLGKSAVVRSAEKEVVVEDYMRGAIRRPVRAFTDGEEGRRVVGASSANASSNATTTAAAAAAVQRGSSRAARYEPPIGGMGKRDAQDYANALKRPYAGSRDLPAAPEVSSRGSSHPTGSALGGRGDMCSLVGVPPRIVRTGEELGEGGGGGESDEKRKRKAKRVSGGGGYRSGRQLDKSPLSASVESDYLVRDKDKALEHWKYHYKKPPRFGGEVAEGVEGRVEVGPVVRHRGGDVGSVRRGEVRTVMLPEEEVEKKKNRKSRVGDFVGKMFSSGRF